MSYHFRNLVFEGGGVKGIAYVGALQALHANNVMESIHRVGGTSAGAINAVLLALGYSLEETYDILSALNFKNFMDDDWGMFRDTKRLIKKYGIYKGDFFREWMGARIAAKTGSERSTFEDLKKRGFTDLYLVGTNLSTGYSEVFSWEHTPKTPVADAVRISMSIPLFFQAIRNKDDVYVDGGLFNNYPVKLFDRLKYVAEADQARHIRRPDYYEKENKVVDLATNSDFSPYVYNKETLGFRLDSSDEIAVFRDRQAPPSKDIDGFFDYASALLGAIMNVQNNQHLHGDDWQRTIYINTLDVKTTDFDIADDKKRKLIKEGSLGMTKYLEWFDEADPDNMPMNHPDCP